MATLHIERRRLTEAVAAGLITAEQAERLWTFLAEQDMPAAAPAQERGPRFTVTNVLYYLGGMVAIGAMSLFMTLGWERFGGWGIFSIALLYMGTAFALARRFERQGLATPMGILAVLSVVLVPLAVWGLLHAIGYWDWVDSPQAMYYRQFHYFVDLRWAALEVPTLAATVVMLYRFRAPFLVMPGAVTLWYMSMDLAMSLRPDASDPWAFLFRCWFSLCFGLVMVLVAFWVDLRWRSARDYAFWLYLFGLLAFSGGLNAIGSEKLWGRLSHLVINLVLVVVGAVLVRRVFTVFGGIGLTIVLVDISWRFFKNSWLFPIALTLIGIAIIYCGIWWHRNEARLAHKIQALLPAPLRELLVARRMNT